MKIVDKYILRQLVVGFLLILVSLTLLVWLMQSLRMIDMVVSKGASVGVFLQITLLALPQFIQILMPLALFAVILFVFIRMQSDKELMVLKAVGMSSKQLMKPALMMAATLTVIGYFLSLWIIPASIQNMRQMRWKLQHNLSSALLQEGQFNALKKGMIIYVRERLPEGKVKGILAYEMKDNQKNTLIAEEGVIYQTNEGYDVQLNQAIRQTYNTITQEFSVLKFDKHTISIPDSQTSDKGRNQKPNELSFWRLVQTPKETLSSPVLWRKYKVEAFKRITQPLYNILFSLLALVGVLTGFYNRQGKSSRIHFVVVSALLIQVFSLAFENASGKNLWCLVLMGGNLLVPLWIIKRIFNKEQGKK